VKLKLQKEILIEEDDIEGKGRLIEPKISWSDQEEITAPTSN
jgi:hypothetical protein